MRSGSHERDRGHTHCLETILAFCVSVIGKLSISAMLLSASLGLLLFSVVAVLKESGVLVPAAPPFPPAESK